MAIRQPGKWFAAGWRAVRGAGPQRLGLTGLLLIAALLLARLGWALPFTDSAERALYDFRAYVLAEKAEQDTRVALVVYTDQTLIGLQKRSPLDRGMLAAALANLDAMGAKAIGIDILFDQPQAEDDALIAQLRAMRTPTFIGYTRVEANADDIRYDQQLYLDDFARRLEGGGTGVGSVLASSSTEGVVRQWPPADSAGPPLLARAMLAGAGAPELPGYAGSIRWRLPQLVDTPVFPSLNIALLADPAIAPGLQSLIAGRYVLIGGDIVGIDRIQTPFTGYVSNATSSGGMETLPPGIEMHAALIAQALDGAAAAPVAGWALWVFALLVVLLAGLTALLELKNWQFVPLMALVVAAIIGLPFLLHTAGIDTHGFPAIGPALGFVLAFTAVSGAARASTAVERKFAQGALGKYLPREMATQIIEHPELLALHGENREIFVLFSDLEGFTKMSNLIPPELVAKLLNRYLEMLSQVVLDHGGVIDKFVGDAVVAFWGAPIARADDGERAAKAGYAIWQAGEAFRRWVAAEHPELPPVGKTRVGLHWGEAVVGNFGGDTRIQYTALGDSMNTAARLESANKALATSVMASREFAARSGLDWWRRMGRVVLSGRAQYVDLMEPAPDFPAADRAALAAALDLVEAGEAQGQALLREVAARYPGDTGLAALAERSGELNAEGAHVLAGK